MRCAPPPRPSHAGFNIVGRLSDSMPPRVVRLVKPRAGTAWRWRPRGHCAKTDTMRGSKLFQRVFHLLINFVFPWSAERQAACPIMALMLVRAAADDTTNKCREWGWVDREEEGTGEGVPRMGRRRLRHGEPVGAPAGTSRSSTLRGSDTVTPITVSVSSHRRGRGCSFLPP